jgi:hypothetical protein
MPRHRHALASLTFASPSKERFISDCRETIKVSNFCRGGYLEVETIDRMRGCSVLLATREQLSSVLALIELDGVAARTLLYTPDSATYLPAIVAEAEVDFIASDRSDAKLASLGVPLVMIGNQIAPHMHPGVCRDIETEYVLFTSGTTGRPKMVVHTLASLSGPINDGVPAARDAVWSTFYDIRRYGGLQILLRAFIGDGSMVLSDADETVGDFMTRLGPSGVTHISGTPSHWRRALMSSRYRVARTGK